MNEIPLLDPISKLIVSSLQKTHGRSYLLALEDHYDIKQVRISDNVSQQQREASKKIYGTGLVSIPPNLCYST